MSYVLLYNKGGETMYYMYVLINVFFSLERKVKNSKFVIM